MRAYLVNLIVKMSKIGFNRLIKFIAKFKINKNKKRY